MSMYPGHRGLPHQGGSSRLNELLEQVRAEFDNQVRVNEDYERQSKQSAPRVKNHMVLTTLAL